MYHVMLAVSVVSAEQVQELTTQVISEKNWRQCPQGGADMATV